MNKGGGIMAKYVIDNITLSKNPVNTGEKFKITVSPVTWNYLNKNYTWGSLKSSRTWGSMVDRS